LRSKNRSRVRKPNANKRSHFTYIPDFYNTLFHCNGNTFFFKLDGSARNNDIEVIKTVQIVSLGWSVEPLKKFLETCREYADQNADLTTNIYTVDKNGWDHIASRPVRPLSTVHFDEKVKKAVVNDIAHYLKNGTRKFYLSRGIPHRRGFLLYGPPGTGKTSLSLALAGHFGLELYMADLSSIKSDQELARNFQMHPPSCIVLLEDVDAVGISKNRAAEVKNTKSDKRAKSDGERNSGPTLAGILNVLDGVASGESRVVIMTSNHEEKLDAALKRPGRIDEKIYFGHISKTVAEQMFIGMYLPPSDEAADPNHVKYIAQLASEFAALVPENTFTPAELQGLLLRHQKSSQAAVENTSAWVEKEHEVRNEAAVRAETALARKAKQEAAKATAKTASRAENPSKSKTGSETSLDNPDCSNTPSSDNILASEDESSANEDTNSGEDSDSD
jgi:chaperone BCS1